LKIILKHGMIRQAESQTPKFKFAQDFNCHNPNLGLATKAKACKVAGQEESPGMKESVRE
jgi:hypothetical protein